MDMCNKPIGFVKHCNWNVNMITSPRGQLAVLISVTETSVLHNVTLVFWNEDWLDSLQLEMEWAWPFFVLLSNCFDVEKPDMGQKHSDCAVAGKFLVVQDFEPYRLAAGDCLISEGKATPNRHLTLPILSPSSYQPLGRTQSAFPCPPSVNPE